MQLRGIIICSYIFLGHKRMNCIKVKIILHPYNEVGRKSHEKK